MHHLLSSTPRPSVVVTKPFHEAWSFADAKAAGYRSKVEKVKWTPEQDAALTRGIEAISTGQSIPHTQDPFWYMTSTFWIRRWTVLPSESASTRGEMQQLDQVGENSSWTVPQIRRQSHKTELPSETPTYCRKENFGSHKPWRS